MDLQRNSVEYAHITFANLPTDATVEASVDLSNWVPGVVISNEVKILLRGPNAPAAANSLLVSEKAELFVRITANPEILVRQAGWIDLY